MIGEAMKAAGEGTKKGNEKGLNGDTRWGGDKREKISESNPEDALRSDEKAGGEGEVKRLSCLPIATVRD